jgi:propanediol dehydratase small subunit
MENDKVHTLSGRALEDLTIEAILSGELSAGDFRISGETLRRQAHAAETAGYRQLAQNLRRAAELTRIPNQKVLDIYNALRPGRASHGQLVALADHLENDLDATLTASLVREAAEVYLERGIIEAVADTETY